MSTAVISFGPKLGLLNNATIGEQYYDQFRPFLRGMDALILPTAISASVVDPPSSPSDGDTYVLAGGSLLTGVWVGHGNQIAVWSNQVTDDGNNTLAPDWDFYTPQDGWVVWVDQLSAFVQYFAVASTWGAGPVLQNSFGVAGQNINQAAGTQFTISIPNGSGQSFMALGAGDIFINANTLRFSDVLATSDTTYTLTTSAPVIFVDALLGNVTVTLPSVSGAIQFIIKRMDSNSNSNTVTVLPNAGGTIDGQSSYVLSANYDFVTLVSNPNIGSAFGIVAHS